MNRYRKFLKRSVCGGFAVLLFMLSLIAAVPQTVFAAGESYTWTADREITAVGGDFTGTNPLQYRPDTNRASGQVTYKDECRFTLILNLSADGKTAVTQTNPGETEAGEVGGGGKKPICNGTDGDGNEKWKGVIAGYNNKTINIAGDKPGAGEESEAEKRVRVVVHSNKSAADSPGTVAISIKQGGKIVAGPIDAPVQVPAWEGGGVPENERSVEYEAVFTLEPGDYQACEVGVVNGCVDFKKEKYQARDTDPVQLGETFSDRDISVEIQLTFYDAVNNARIIGPVDVTRQKADNSGAITTVKTNSKDVTPTPEQAESDAYGERQVELNALFRGVEPGEYRVCVPDIKECQTVTKKPGEALEIVFKTRKANELTQGYQRDPDERCPNLLKSWAISKIACPMVTAADTAIQKIEEVFGGMMIIDVADVFGSSNDQGLEQSENAKAYYQAWNVFRTLAVMIIVLTGIFMVVSEAMGFGFVDAYTIRKLLPRLLIALLVIAVSWWLLMAVIQFFNNLTIWTATLINYPFSSIPEPNASAWTAVGQWAFITGLLATVGPLVILLYAGTVLVAIFAATAVLIIREIIIILAVVMAPFFIAMFIVPNLEKLGSLWRGVLLVLLVMGPIFMAIAESGSVVYKIVGSKDPTGILASLSLLLPLFLIIFLFIKIGGFAGSIIGFANDKTKGVFDRLSNARKSEMGRRGEAAKKGELFQGTFTRKVGLGGISKGLNTATRAASGGGFKRGVPLTKRGRMQWQAAMAQNAVLMGQAQAKTPEGEAGQFNDYMLRMQTYQDEDQARANAAKDFGMYKKDASGTVLHDSEGNAIEDTDAIETGIAAAKANGGFGAARQMYALDALAASGTGYDDLPDLAKAIARVAQGNDQLIEQLAKTAKKNVGRSKRNDLAPSANTIADLAKKEAAALRGKGNAPTQLEYHTASMEAFDTTDPMAFARNRSESIANFSKTLRTELTLAQDQYDDSKVRGSRAQYEKAQARLGKAVANVRNVQDTLSFMPAKAVQSFNEEILKPDAVGGTRHSDILGRTEALLSRQAPEKTETMLRARTDRGGNIKGFSPVFDVQKDAVGNAVDFRPQQQQVPNPAYTPNFDDNSALVESYNSFRSQMSLDPNDPNSPLFGS